MISLIPGENHIGIVVCAVVHDGNGNILLLKRGKNARDEHGKWDICGGSLEFDETVETAMERELNEELRTKSLETKILTVFDAQRKIKGKETHWVAILHSILVDPTTVQIGEPNKFDEIKWYKLSSLPESLHSQFPKVLAAAQKANIIF